MSAQTEVIPAGLGPLVLHKGEDKHDLAIDTAPVESLALDFKKANPTQKATFFSLSLEVRQMIYNEVYDGWWVYGIFAWDLDGGIYHARDNEFCEAKLNQVCRQMYQDVTPFIYKKVDVYDRFDDWSRFFTSIGAHNISKINELNLQYSCKTWGNEMGCMGRDKFTEEYCRWETIFWCLSQVDFQAKSVRISFYPCDPSPCWRSLANEETELLERRYTYSECQVHEDWAFLKGIYTCFKNVRRLVLDGHVNPVWPFALRHSLGFVLKQEIDRVVLLNPEWIRPHIDLKDCNLVRPGVYELPSPPWPEPEW
ncbi:hypothetical protein F4811DRAFT_568747 [Daldinia bambusicola]|nr:hypothetical protein F4811DRAFT_568747 [Daldinia bambusicola]